MTCECDLAIVGGGPAGLSAAINGASEGLRVRLLDSGGSLGGQARESSAIENYPGFPDGVTGEILMTNFVAQANRFQAMMLCPVGVVSMATDGLHRVLSTDDGSTIIAKTVILANGLSYRRLTASGLGPLMGRGVHYGMPSVIPNRQCNIVVVGGANSAGQAVVRLAANTRARIKMVIRKTLAAQMSQYLIDRITRLPNVEVCEGCEVMAVFGLRRLEGARLRHADGREETLDADLLLIYIGAAPKTYWLRETVGLTGGFIQTFRDAGNDIPYMTTVPGVFAAGDVRLGSTKRIATAIGEGAAALQAVHQYLETI